MRAEAEKHPSLILGDPTEESCHPSQSGGPALALLLVIPRGNLRYQPWLLQNQQRRQQQVLDTLVRVGRVIHFAQRVRAGAFAAAAHGDRRDAQVHRYIRVRRT